jgi:hypothetical protein
MSLEIMKDLLKLHPEMRFKSHLRQLKMGMVKQGYLERRQGK